MSTVTSAIAQLAVCGSPDTGASERLNTTVVDVDDDGGAYHAPDESDSESVMEESFVDSDGDDTKTAARKTPLRPTAIQACST